MLATLLSAQDLPQPSPSATVIQRVGLTDFTVKYSRPAAKDRKVFGELVPYGQLWRTGANINSTITFNTPVTIMDQVVEPGSYSIFTIPSDGEWVVILNSGTKYWGTGDFDEKKNVATFNIGSTETKFVETLTIGFDKVVGDNAELYIAWENTMVSLPLAVETQKQAIANIEQALADAQGDDKKGVYRNAANYYYNQKIDAEKALEYINLAVEGNTTNWYTFWLRAEILAENGNYKEAIKSAEKSKRMGKEAAKEGGKSFAYAAMIDQGIATWKKAK